MKRAKKVGIYGGTFDPLHFGHISLAVQIKEIHQLDEVWFCPVQANPHKVGQKITAFYHRFQMVELVLKDIPQFYITDVEAGCSGASYTINTLHALFNEQKIKGVEVEFSLIMGDDAIPNFFRWHRPEEIVRLVPLYIGRRVEKPIDVSLLTGNQEICDAIKRGMTQTHMLDISGTDIRKRLCQKLYCGHLLPEKVLDYIYSNDLYCS